MENMTKIEFENLKVGDVVYLRPKKHSRGTGTEVLEIDRYFNKIKVLLGNGWLSYKYISKHTKNFEVSCFVGVCK